MLFLYELKVDCFIKKKKKQDNIKSLYKFKETLHLSLFYLFKYFTLFYHKHYYNLIYYTKKCIVITRNEDKYQFMVLLR